MKENQLGATLIQYPVFYTLDEIFYSTIITLISTININFQFQAFCDFCMAGLIMVTWFKQYQKSGFYLYKLQITANTCNKAIWFQGGKMFSKVQKYTMKYLKRIEI